MTNNPTALLQKLIQFDTSNPPGNEEACIQYIQEVLETAGISTTLYAKAPHRPNLLARLKGTGNAPPLLLYGHVDVVSTAHQIWQYPPFAGTIADGFLWGRGALDMKSGVTMMLSAFLQAQEKGLQPAGDIMLLILGDEEANGDYGAKYLVEEEADLFAGIRYALGEFGGFSLSIGNQTFYPIQVAEKQVCQLHATFRGAGGHGALRTQGEAMAKLGKFLQRLDQTAHPVHLTPVVNQMLTQISAHVPFPLSNLITRLQNPLTANTALKIMGNQGKAFDPILHHTVNATLIQGGTQINVIPSEITVKLDGRILPGYGPGDLIKEVYKIVGKDVSLIATHFDQGPPSPNMDLFDLLASTLQEADPTGIPVPYLMPGVTDGRFLAKLGIQTYGFTPMKLPANFDFMSLIHAADERIPLEAMTFGTNAIYRVLEQYRG